MTDPLVREPNEALRLATTEEHLKTLLPAEKPNAPASKEYNRLKIWLTMTPQIPLMLRTAALHAAGFTKQSKYLDLKTEVLINVLRAYINPAQPMSISHTQKFLNNFPAIKGKVWISTYACWDPSYRLKADWPPNTQGIQEAILKTINGLRHPGTPPPAITMPEVLPVEAEWTGYRKDATAESRLPEGLSQKELYGEMMKEVTSRTTILYMHGGAYWLMDPATHRAASRLLAKLTGGRVYSVRYRLAPQNPFPSQLVDALVSYLGLLYPPEGAFHTAVRAEDIVFAGDSAGGNLALSLIQVILYLQRNQINKVMWQGRMVEIPLPAGVAVSSPWMDVTHSSESCKRNAEYDYLPEPSTMRAAEKKRPACKVWPASPPRQHVYCSNEMIPHPLVSVILAPSWKGAPPMYICTGWELLADEDKFAAQKMWREGVDVILEEYEGMPHCFSVLFPLIKEARRCNQGWAGFIKNAVESPERLRGKSRFVTVKAGSIEEVEIKEEDVSKETQEEIKVRIFDRVRSGAVAAEGEVAKL
ncbi:putative acetyl-hydrolase [Podospora australis]|uniref:Acetyl-hydrolase n=1 Tax=Podospora australis TaxID=1536484 RepID=A0AAN6WNT1_9PEZI|nr:putative acetyl-hydrolase [Podospora australis]